MAKEEKLEYVLHREKERKKNGENLILCSFLFV